MLARKFQEIKNTMHWYIDVYFDEVKDKIDKEYILPSRLLDLNDINKFANKFSIKISQVEEIWNNITFNNNLCQGL